VPRRSNLSPRKKAPGGGERDPEGRKRTQKKGRRPRGRRTRRCRQPQKEKDCGQEEKEKNGKKRLLVERRGERKKEISNLPALKEEGSAGEKGVRQEKHLNGRDTEKGGGKGERKDEISRFRTRKLKKGSERESGNLGSCCAQGIEKKKLKENRGYSHEKQKKTVPIKNISVKEKKWGIPKRGRKKM